LHQSELLDVARPDRKECTKADPSVSPQCVAAPEKKMDGMFNYDRYPKEAQAFRTLEGFATCAGKLYWVAFVLTGDRQKAQEIILPAVDDVADSHTMFWQWLCTWAVRMVVTSCARHYAHELSKENGTSDFWGLKLIERSSVKLQISPLSKEQLQRALLRIPLFPRFVFLLRVLEGYAMPDIARILGVDEDSCEASLSYAYFALPEALMSA
jgi:DNA-directed RNA polymerase specialized sigma24 family protein